MQGVSKMFFKRNSKTPSISGLTGSDDDKPSWTQGARQLHREIARDLLTHTHTSAVFDDGPGDKGAPAIKPRIAESPSIVLTGHGAGALVAYQTTMSLLQHYPEALKERLKCITFGMPVMGWQGREQRDSLLRLIAPQLTSTPLLRRDLPCPHFLHIVRQEDVVPATCVCSRKVRRSVAGALSLAARHRDPHTTPSTPPSGHSPYSKPYCDALLSLGDHDAARGGDVTSAGVSEEEEVAGVSPGFPLPTRHDDDSDDSDAAYSPAVILPGAAHAVDARRRDGNAESEGSEGVRGVGGWKGWKGWKKNDTVGLNGSTVDWDLVYKAVRDDVCNVSLPEWWPLGKFWFLCDSVPFDSAPPPSNAGPHAASGSNNNKTRRGEQATQTSAGATTRRDGTLVRVRRWVVQFPYFIQMSQSGVREVFEPWPESVGLLRDMLAGVVENAIDNGTPPKRLLGVQPISSAQLRRRHWAVEHHIGQYINALHSWVGSSEWQISRRRELASSLSTLPTKLESVSEDASAEAEEECSGAHAQPDHDAPQPHMLGACPGINGAKTTYGEVAACQVRADGGECRCIHDGVRTLLQITLRGHNLHFVEAVQLCLYSWGVSQTDAHLHQSLSASSPPRAAVAGAGVGGARGDEGRQTGQASTGANEAFLKVRMVVSRSESGSSRLVATCDAPHGWIGAGVEARLLGSCIGEVFVKCDASGLTSFRALHPAVASLENAPVCTLLEQALLLQDLVLRRSNQHAAHSQAVGEASAVQQKRARRPVQIGDVTASSMHLPYLDLTTAEGAEIVEEVVAELMNLEHKTRSQWSDFMRTISLGGLDPHASHTWSQRAPPHSLSASPKTQSGNWRLAATCDGDESVDIGAKVEEDEDEISSGRKTMKLRVAAQLRAQRRKLACLKEIDQLLSRPLSLSMDRSPRLKQIMGLTLGISAGATIMAGSCLLAPYAAASVMPAMAAYVTPAHAVTGMFATSMVGTHMQARCTIDGSYMDKLRHFAGALRIQTSLIRSRAMYLEAAIATRVLNHVSSVLSLSPICSMTELLAKPALFVSVLAQPDSWRRLIDARHYFEFLDFKDKKFVLDFLWVMVTMHRVRAELVSTVSVAVVAPNISSPLNQALLSNLFPTAFARGAVEDASGGQVVEQGSGGDMEQQDADDEERGWKLESYQLPIAAASVRVDTINLPHAYLAHKLEVQDQAAQDPAAHHYSSDTRQSTSTSPNNGKGVWSAKRAELVRGLAAAEVLVVGWHEASLAGTMLLIGRLLARRASSTLPQAPHEFMTCGGTDCRSIRKDCSSSRKVADTGSERGFAFKVLLTGVPRGDSGALAWLADKINRKLDVTRWRSFIAVARRRMRMQRPECLDASFLETVAHEAVQELDLRPTDVPDVVDIELLLASGALDDDWLTRPKLQLETADMLPLTYLADQDDACHAQSEGAQSSSLHPSALHPSAVANKPQVAPAFSLLHDVADKKAQAQQQLPSEKLQPVNGQAEVKVVHLEMLAVCLLSQLFLSSFAALSLAAL